MAAVENYPREDGEQRGSGSRYGEAFDALIAREVDAGRIAVSREPGREYLYRPGEVLVPERAVDRVLESLRTLYPGLLDGISVGDGCDGVVRLSLADGADASVPDIVATLRAQRDWGGDPAPWVQPHHVTVGYPRLMGNPEHPPVPASTRPTPPDRARAASGLGVTVGICDTGMWELAATEHKAWFAGRYRAEADDVDGLHDPGDPSQLALQAGHGTFVAGVLRETAPGVRIDPEAALDPNGLGDELTLARALAGLERGVEVINLSLGCVTMDNAPSLPIWEQLQRLGRERVVVASAGNAGDTRPRWPAAFKQVIGVASVVLGGGGVRPDADSSHGPWVDACAPGTWTTTFVRGTASAAAGEVTFDDPFATWSGTSFAAPVVAGRICEIMTQHGVGAREAARRLLDRPRWHPDYGVLVL